MLAQGEIVCTADEVIADAINYPAGHGSGIVLGSGRRVRRITKGQILAGLHCRADEMAAEDSKLASEW